jgi:hypothetical protein
MVRDIRPHVVYTSGVSPNGGTHVIKHAQHPTLED